MDNHQKAALLGVILTYFLFGMVTGVWNPFLVPLLGLGLLFMGGGHVTLSFLLALAVFFVGSYFLFSLKGTARLIYAVAYMAVIAVLFIQLPYIEAVQGLRMS